MQGVVQCLLTHPFSFSWPPMGGGETNNAKNSKLVHVVPKKRLFSKMKRTDLDYPSFFSLTWSVKLFWPFSIGFFPPSTTLVDKAAGAKELFLE